MKKPTLCAECRHKRLLYGMANAKAKGVRIGRVRKRNSALIESLLEAGMSFRQIALVSKCSHGSVSAQKKEWLAKKAAAEKKKISELTKELSINTVTSTIEQMKSLNISDDLSAKVQEKLESNARENVRAIQGDTVYETID